MASKMGEVYDRLDTIKADAAELFANWENDEDLATVAGKASALRIKLTNAEGVLDKLVAAVGELDD
jgi:hypothetical protein